MNRYGRPTTYKRITPERGSGLILKRIYELTEDPKLPHGAGSYPTKRDVYRVTPWYNRPGWSSLLWSSLIKDGLIESIDGLQKVKLPRSYWHARRDSNVSYRAAGRYVYGIGYTVRYRLTPKGRGILFDMMDRVGAKGKTLNSVGSVAEHDAKKLEELKAARRKARAEARAKAKEANADILASVKVGDVFSMSWGYDQTNVDFFQVVERVGKSSVRIREVCPLIISEEPGMMCATRKYAIPHDGKMLLPKEYSVFIKNQKGNGDVKRIQVSEYFKDKRVYLNIGSHFAYREMGDVAEHYESWYA